MLASPRHHGRDSLVNDSVHLAAHSIGILLVADGWQVDQDVLGRASRRAASPRSAATRTSLGGIHVCCARRAPPPQSRAVCRSSRHAPRRLGRASRRALDRGLSRPSCCSSVSRGSFQCCRVAPGDASASRSPGAETPPRVRDRPLRIGRVSAHGPRTWAFALESAATIEISEAQSAAATAEGRSPPGPARAVAQSFHELGDGQVPRTISLRRCLFHGAIVWQQERYSRSNNCSDSIPMTGSGAVSWAQLKPDLVVDAVDRVPSGRF